MTLKWRPVIAFFYCQNIPEGGWEERLAIEKKHKGAVRLFPIPCSGRIDGVHLLRALEEFADGAIVATCPPGGCLNFEGNLWARKRAETSRKLIKSIGLEGERILIVEGTAGKSLDLMDLAEGFLQKISLIGPSPVLYPKDMPPGTGVGFSLKGESVHDYC